MEEIQKVEPTREEMRAKIMHLEEAISNEEGAVFGNDACPLKHTFVDGAYVREIVNPKGMVITTKIHKIEHPYFVMKGECIVVTDDSIKRIKAPHWGVTQPGTKRAIYVLEEMTWITVHVTDSRNLEEIESELIAESFDELPEKVKLKLMEE